MSFESPVLEAEPEKGIEEKEEETRFSRSEALAQGNSVVEQIKAYTEHVKQLAAKSGKTIERVVAEEQSKVSRLGIYEFLRNVKE